MKIIELGLKFGISDEDFRNFMNSMIPMEIPVIPGGLLLYQYIKSIYKGLPLTIVETGTLRDANPSALFSDGWSTFYLAKFAKETNSKLISIEPDLAAITTCISLLRGYGLDDIKFIPKYSPDALSEVPDQVDFFLLDSCDGLEHGLEEFKAALEHDPIAIAMDDYETKAKLAVEYAKTKGINVTALDRYHIFVP